MPDDFETVLRAGAQQFAGATVPVTAELVRARGNQRQHRLMAAGAAIAVLVIAGGAVAAAGGLARQHRAPAISREGIGLRLTAPREYTAGLPNPVSFTISNPGHARIVTVDLNLGESYHSTYRKAIVERFDVTSGKWITIGLRRLPSGWSASYALRLSAGDTAQRLLIVPATPNFTPPVPVVPLTVTIASGARIVAERQAPVARLAEVTGTWTGPALIARGRAAEYAFTVRNPGSARFPVQLSLSASLFCPYGRPSCRGPALGYQLQWLDGSTWRPLSPSAYELPGYGQLLAEVPLAPHGSATITIRLMVGRHSASKVGELVCSVQPDLARFPVPASPYPNSGGDFISGIISAG